MNHEKTSTKKAAKTVGNIILTYDSSVTLMSALVKNRLMDGSFCGGRGDCGRCRVRFLEGAPLPTGVERARLTPEELRLGYRLGCMSRPKADCVVEIAGVEEPDVPIVTEVILPSENIDSNGLRNTLSGNQKAAAMVSDAGMTISADENRCYVIAVDLGTTTIAMQLRDVETGEAADTYCERNPQRIYGTDVLSRIQASCAGHREELCRLVCGTLLRGLRQFAQYLQKGEASRGLAEGTDAVQRLRKAVCMCIAGNTTMEHLLLGYDVDTLGKAPFVPAETGLQEISLIRLFSDMEGFSKEAEEILSGQVKFPVYILPCISAFVGGDIVAGLYAVRMFSAAGTVPGTIAGTDGEEECEKAESEGGGRAVLLIDLGTNGEMVMTDGKRMAATAAAAGPAFEGDGILIGTDRIAFTAELLRRGILDETGLLAEPYFTEGVCIEKEKEDTSKNKNICYFKQEDVRALQMAKAAVRAGVEILWEELGCPEIEKVYLAGGFGYYLDVEAAFDIGLLPAHMRGRVLAAGNTSLEGAYEMGRDLCRGRLDAALLEEKLSSVTGINLARKKNFEGLYLKYMNLERN